MERKAGRAVFKSMAAAWIAVLMVLTGSVSSQAIPTPDSKVKNAKLNADSTAAKPFEVLPDSSNFVTASLLIGSPLPVFYSVFGHATLRMECPAHQLDYVFTFESDPNISGFMTGVAGKAKAKFMALPTQEYIDLSQKLGRELWQYKLNLTPDEKKEFWRLLDNELVAGEYRHFNLLYTNCLTTTISAMRESLIGEHLEWGPTRYPMTLNDGDLFRLTVRRAPWSEFVYITFFGTAYERYSPREVRLIPEFVIPVLRETTFVNDSTGEHRPVLADKGVRILKGKPFPTYSFTPTIAFAALLVLTLLVTLCEWLLRWRRLAKIYDISLFSAQALVGALLVYVTFCSELFPGMWNWYLVAFFPIPLLIWLYSRKGRHARKCWLVYSVVLLLFLLATPFLGALDLPHQLITASLLVRSLKNIGRHNPKS
ncbi:MAG: DUF4105 domain-containing protein [Prevotella sp.]|nr:DUF4105 domain-containing protein [Prevotella sp.]